MDRSVTAQTKPHRRLPFLLLALSILLAAYALRIYQLDAVPLRGDEAYSVVHWTATPFSEDWQQLWRDEPAPVGAFTLYWLWVGLAGDSPLALRFVSVLGSLIGAAGIMALAHRLVGHWHWAALAGLLWAVHPFLIWHAQDARVYGVLSGISPLAFYWLLRALDQPHAGWRTWRPYILLQTLALYLYYLEPLWLAAAGLYVLSLGDRHALRQAIRAWLIIGFLALPVLAQLYTLIFVSAYQGTAQAAGGDLLFTWFVPTLFFGENHWPLLAGLAVALGLAGLLLLVVAPWKRHTALLILLWLYVPPVLLFVASLFSDFFRPRYVITVVPALILALTAISAAAFARWPNTLTRIVPRAVLLGVMIVCLIEVRDYFFYDPPKAPDWPGLAQEIALRGDADTVFIFDTPDPAIEYYFPDGAGTAYILPLDFFSQAWQPEIDRLLQHYHALYVLQGPSTGPLADYLQRTAQDIPGIQRSGMLHFRRKEVHPAEIAVPLEVRFEDVAVLRGYTLLNDETLLLYWEALAATDTEFSVLLHLQADPDAPVLALDHAMANWQVSMQTWQPGQLYRDPVALPPDLMPGSYTLLTGFYSDTDGDGTIDVVIDADGADRAGRVAFGALVAHNQHPE